MIAESVIVQRRMVSLNTTRGTRRCTPAIFGSTTSDPQLVAKSYNRSSASAPSQSS